MMHIYISMNSLLWFTFHVIMDELKFVANFYIFRCGPCRYVAPEFEKLAELNPNVVFIKVDVDDASEIAAKCGIRAMPTFHYYKGGEKVAEVVGADVDKIKALVATHA